MYEKYVELRDARNLKDADVARGTGLSPVVFSEWKKGKSKPKHEKMIKIANYFNVDVEYFNEYFDSQSLNYSMKISYREKEDYEIAHNLITLLNQLDRNDAQSVLDFAKFKLSDGKYKKDNVQNSEVS